MGSVPLFSLRNYLSDVRSIEFEFDPLAIEDFVSLRGIKLDDGANTPLDQKGDGVKSLFAMALMQFIAEQQPSTRLVFGIEEPESHLHPSKVYDIKASLRGLSANHQVIISTHSPILVQRDSISSNIIVSRIQSSDFACCAKPAKRLQEIQTALGVKPEDNLLTASVLVVVEGATEEACLAELLSRVDQNLSPAFADGQVRLLSAAGASKIVGVVRSLAPYSASCVVLTDSDAAGEAARLAVLSSGLVGSADVYAVPPKTGQRETEFEDVFDPTLYMDEVNSTCGVALSPAEFVTARLRSGSRTTALSKWSDVMAALFARAGKRWEECEISAKTAVGRAIAKKASQVPLAELVFLQGMGSQIRRYLVR
jgi:putative ATP-dependent endonuclease of the OLD family